MTINKNANFANYVMNVYFLFNINHEIHKKK